MSNFSQPGFFRKINNRDVYFLGIRHHGPGCARALKTMLYEIQPDVVLLECPADGLDALELLPIDEFRPPVALAIYDPKNPGQSVFYPLTSFSPEWIAINYARQKGISLFPIDLPSSAVLNFPKENTESAKSEKSIDY